MEKRRTNPGALLPVQTSGITKSLTSIYARLRGELLKAKNDEDVLIESKAAKAYMHHIDGLMPLFGAEFEPKGFNAGLTHGGRILVLGFQLSHVVLDRRRGNASMAVFAQTRHF